MRLLLALLLLPAASGLTVNEIMYNPSQCSDAYCEWLELFAAEEVDMRNVTLCGSSLTAGFLNKSDGRIMGDNGYILPANSYVIITDGVTGTEAYNYFNITGYAYHVDSSSICGELGNNGGSITLAYKNNITIDYEGELADGNGKSLEWNGNAWEESLVSAGTPGRSNSVVEPFSLIITEFLPDPIGNDDGEMPSGEWVEIYNNGNKEVDARGFVLKDSKNENELYITDTNTNGTIVPAGGYLVVYRNQDSDFAMNNKGYDELRLFAGNRVLDLVSYSGSTEGLSWSFVDGNWKKTVPTPGRENLGIGGCDWQVSINSSPIYNGSNVDFTIITQKNYGGASILTVRGLVEDPFGTMVKEYKPFSNATITRSRTTHYSPNLKDGIYLLKFWMDSVDCADEHPENDKAVTLIAVNPEKKVSLESLSIERLYDLGSDDKAEWGDTIRAKLIANSDKRGSIKLFIENDGERVSKIISIDAKEASLTIPIKINDNCKAENEDGEYKVVADGFGLRAEYELEIEGYDKDACGYKGLDIMFESIPDKIVANHKFNVLLKVQSAAEDKLEVVAEILKGRAELDSKKEQISIGRFQSKTLRLPFEGLPAGDYKLKVKAMGKASKTIDTELHVGEDEGMILDLYHEPEGDKTKLVVASNATGYRLELLSLGGEQSKIINGTHTDFEVPLLKGSNPFFVKLTNGEEEIEDLSEIVLDYDGNLVSIGRKDNEFLEKLKALNGRQGVVIYESSSARARQLVPLILIADLAILSLALIFKRL